MSELRLKIHPALVKPFERNYRAHDWAMNYGFEFIGSRIDDALQGLTDSFEPVRVIPEFEHQLGQAKPNIRFEFETGRFYSTERAATEIALSLYKAIKQEVTRLQTKGVDNVKLNETLAWGLHFKHKGSFDDIWITPDNVDRVRRRFESLST